jgi:DNA (cytosine-5)-methyltransferase 1
MTAYYNEIDPYAAQWLRNLIAKGHIAAGEVDERSIEDVRPDDLRGFTQCHFFAGIGVWSYALRLAGWPDDRPVWTGSCPCQPFSQAGKGAGFSDERHLWPAWDWLISECRPAVIVGEQVASKDIDPWIDLVQADLEAMGYAIGCVPFPSAGVGAPHIRDRAYFMAYADHARPQGRKRVRERATERAARSSGVAGLVADAERGAAERQRLDVGSAASGVRRSSRQQRVRDDTGDGRDAGRLADAMRAGSLPGALAGIHRGEKSAGPRDGELERLGDARELADADVSARGQRRSVDGGRHSRGDAIARAGLGSDGLPDGFERIEAAGPTNGFWRDADWLLCRDEKWRPVRPGSFPLADGAPSRVGRLRAYGNAINAQAAAEFIRAAREAI